MVSFFPDVELCAHICTDANMGCDCAQTWVWKLLFDMCIGAAESENL